MKKKILNVCGVCNNEDIRIAEGWGADWISLVFNPSSSCHINMMSTHAGIIPDKVNPEAINPAISTTKKVGVFFDEMGQNIIISAFNFKLNFIQFHGSETPTFIRNLRRTIDPDICSGIQFIKTIFVNQEKDISAYKAYEGCVDYFLFETINDDVNAPKEHFAWQWFNAYNGAKPFLLSGNITLRDIETLQQTVRHPLFAGISIHFALNNV